MSVPDSEQEVSSTGRRRSAVVDGGARSVLGCPSRPVARKRLEEKMDG